MLQAPSRSSAARAAVKIVPDVHSTFATFLLAESAFSPGPAVFMAKTGVTDLSSLSLHNAVPSLSFLAGNNLQLPLLTQ